MIFILYLAPVERFREFNKLVTEKYIFLDFGDVIFDTVIMQVSNLLEILI